MSSCPHCGRPINQSDERYAYRQITGWERRAVGEHRRGGSDITLREPTGVLAHGQCIDRAKMGVAPSQEALSL